MKTQLWRRGSKSRAAGMQRKAYRPLKKVKHAFAVMQNRLPLTIPLHHIGRKATRTAVTSWPLELRNRAVRVKGQPLEKQSPLREPEGWQSGKTRYAQARSVITCGSTMGLRPRHTATVGETLAIVCSSPAGGANPLSCATLTVRGGRPGPNPGFPVGDCLLEASGAAWKDTQGKTGPAMQIASGEAMIGPILPMHATWKPVSSPGHRCASSNMPHGQTRLSKRIMKNVIQRAKEVGNGIRGATNVFETNQQRMNYEGRIARFAVSGVPGTETDRLYRLVVVVGNRPAMGWSGDRGRNLGRCCLCAFNRQITQSAPPLSLCCKQGKMAARGVGPVGRVG